MFQGIFKSAINDANKNYIFGTGSIPINIKVANLETFAKAENKQQGYQVAEVNKLISTMLTGWNANGNKPKSMSDNYLELILSCDNGFVVKKRLQFPHIIAWQNDNTPYNIADIYKEFSIDNWLKADDFENPDITLVVEPTDEILTTSTATPPEVTTTNSGRFYLYYRNLPIGVNRIHIDFHIKTKTEPIDFDLEVVDGLSWKDAQVILASNEQAKINVLLNGVKDVYKYTGAEGNFEEITMHQWSELYQQIISLNPSNKFTHDLIFCLPELGQKVYDFVTMTKGAYISNNQGVGNVCPLTQTTYDGMDCAVIELKKGQTINITGVGGRSSRLWAILDKDSHIIIDAAKENPSGTPMPFVKELIVPYDCIVIVNVYNENATPPYGNYKEIPYSVMIESFVKEKEVAIFGMTKRMPSTAAQFNTLWDKFVTDGFAVRTTIATPDSKPVYCYHIDPYNKIAKNPKNASAFTITDNDYFAKKKLLLISGVHGDEKQTPLWLYEFINRIIYNSEYAALRSAYDWWVVPMVNPTGYDADTRNNYNNVNINRDFDRKTQEETIAICNLIDNGNFDLFLDAHQMSGGSGKSNISPDVCTAFIPSILMSNEVLMDLCTKFSRGGAKADAELNKAYTKNVRQSAYVWPPIAITEGDLQSHEYAEQHGIVDSFEFEFTQYAYIFSNSDVKYNKDSMIYGNTMFHYLMEAFL